MRENNIMIRHAFLLSVLAASLSACGKMGKTGALGNANAALAAPAVERPLLISPEDILTVRSSPLASGPSITGSVQPERRADLRAEVSAVVLQVLKENGDAVRRGDLLVRLDDTAIRDTFTAAEASENAAARAYEQAERQFQRMATLRQTGVVSVQQLEDAESRRNTAQSDREAARTRVVSARQELERTRVRAPFDGIVSERKVSAGDTAQIGKELLKVIDPRSMRFEGMISADSVGEVKAGQTVVFRIHGLAEPTFSGWITRVNPAANVTTRQVEVLVAFADARQQPQMSGLYADGWIETRSTAALTIPASALVKDGDRAFAWRLSDHALWKASLSVGERDARTGEFALKGGLAQGDRVLRYPTANLRDGQKIELAAAAPPAGPGPVRSDAQK